MLVLRRTVVCCKTCKVNQFEKSVLFHSPSIQNKYIHICYHSSISFNVISFHVRAAGRFQNRLWQNEKQLAKRLSSLLPHTTKMQQTTLKTPQYTKAQLLEKAETLWHKVKCCLSAIFAFVKMFSNVERCSCVKMRRQVGKG